MHSKELNGYPVLMVNSQMRCPFINPAQCSPHSLTTGSTLSFQRTVLDEFRDSASCPVTSFEQSSTYSDRAIELPIDLDDQEKPLLKLREENER
jgi:hypothetical protein